MAKEETKKETKPKEPTQEEVRKMVKTDLTFFRDVTNFVKQMKDNGCLSVNMETDIRDFIEEQVRVIIGLPAKPKPPVYIPPPQPPTPPTQPTYPPRHY